MNLDLMVIICEPEGGNKSNQNSEVFYLSKMLMNPVIKKKRQKDIPSKEKIFFCMWLLPPRKNHGTWWALGFGGGTFFPQVCYSGLFTK